MTTEEKKNVKSSHNINLETIDFNKNKSRLTR